MSPTLSFWFTLAIHLDTDLDRKCLWVQVLISHLAKQVWHANLAILKHTNTEQK